MLVGEWHPSYEPLCGGPVGSVEEIIESYGVVLGMSGRVGPHFSAWRQTAIKKGRGGAPKLEPKPPLTGVQCPAPAPENDAANDEAALELKERYYKERLARFGTELPP
jgi:hypothetical protein